MSKNKGSVLVPLLIVALIVVFIVAGYFFWQNQQLQNQSIINTQTQSPTPTIFTEERTVNWNTYTDKYSNLYTVKYPPGWDIDDSGSPVSFRSPDGTKYISIESGEPLIGNDKNTSVEVKEGSTDGVSTTKYYFDRTSLGYKDYEMLTVIKSGSPDFYITASSKDNNFDYVDQILSTFKFTNKAIPTSTQPSKNIKVLNYSLPSGWKTIQSSSGNIEAGYDSSFFTASPGSSDSQVYINTNLGAVRSAEIAPYDGGSRHLNLYKKIGLNDEILKANMWKHPEYHENEYSYNGSTCLVLVGVDISQYPQVWGICPLNGNEAIYFTDGGLDDGMIEQFIQTIKVKK